MNKEQITVPMERLMWLMESYHENLLWINDQNLPMIKNPYCRDDQKEENKLVAFHLTMIENEPEYKPQNSPAYISAQKLLKESFSDDGHYFDNIAHAHYM